VHRRADRDRALAAFIVAALGVLALLAWGFAERAAR
jgi:hypothetical protein